MSINDQAGLTAEQLADKYDPASETPEPEVVTRRWELPAWVTIPRLDEPVESYMQHPLNFARSEGMAYILRGVSALVGGVLNYWWMDVLGGVMRLRKETAAAKAPAPETGP